MPHIIPPDPNVIRAQLNAPSSKNQFTAREMSHYNNPNTMQVEYGISDPAYQGAQNIMTGQLQGSTAPKTIESPFTAIPEAASRGEFYEAVRVFAEESDVFMGPDDESLYPEMPSEGYWYRNLYEESHPGENFTATSGPASITEVPTSTTNPQRPRTVAAGYDPPRQCLTVVFRDGTYYNYYQVSNTQWQNFKRARSKGRFILTYLDSHSRGVADVSTLSQHAREALYRVTRTGQIKREGITNKQSPKSTRGGRGAYKSGNLGGTGRKRNKGK